MSVKELTTIEEYQSAIRDNELVIVDVFAEWCAPCKAMLPILESVNEDEDVVIFKVDADKDEMSSIMIENAIRSIPTMMFFKDGNKVDVLIGQQSRDEIVTKINSL